MIVVGLVGEGRARWILEVGWWEAGKKPGGEGCEVD